jgi:hypothetical protein
MLVCCAYFKFVWLSWLRLGQELRGTPKIVMSAFGGPDSAAITRPHSSKFLLVRGTFAALRVLLHYDYNPLVVLVNLLYT